MATKNDQPPAAAPQEPGGSSLRDHGEYGRVAERYVIGLRNTYRRRSAWHRRLFRLSGMLVILLSITLPLLAVSSYQHKDLALSIIGIVIAVITALHSFYQWDRNWGLLRRTDFSLTEAYSEWELEMVHAQSLLKGRELDQFRYETTRTLLAKANTLRGQESDTYFESLRFPQKPQPEPGKPPVQ